MSFLVPCPLAFRLCRFSLWCHASTNNRENLSVGVGSVFLANKPSRYCPTMQRQYQLGHLLSRAGSEFRSICKFFLVWFHNQAFTNSQLLGSELKLNSPALLSSAWRKVHCKWREKSLQVWCPKLTPEWRGQLTKKSRGLRLRRST